MTDNELIAQFMKNDAINSPHLKTAKELEDTYNYSWDWLMPVVEKIASTDEGYWFLITINGRSDNRQTGCSINRGKRAFEPITKDQGNKPLIDTVYQAVVEFIKWYNTQNNKLGHARHESLTS